MSSQVNHLLASVTGLPGDLGELLRFTATAHAEAMKFGIEHFRRRRPHCSGTLIWQLNDAWPGFSWALIDHTGFRKAAYWATRRAYSPVLPCFRTTADGVELWVVNDTTENFTADLVVTHGTFDGAVDWTWPVAAAVPALHSAVVGRIPAARLTADAAHYLWVHSAAGGAPDNRHFFAPMKDLRLPEPGLEHVTEPLPGGELAIRLRTGSYARAVTLAGRDETIRYSDNYVDLRPGSDRTIVASCPGRALTSADIEVGVG